jgi:myo-inositol-1(or 4)-monophosphatase
VTDPLLPELLDLALEAARRAGELLRDGRPADLGVAATKSSPIDVVTEMDIAAEKLITGFLTEHRPDDGFLGEEGAATVGTSGVRWVIDPLDGTVNYANGLPVFCVSIGLVHDGRPVAGAVLDPTRGETYAAAVDGPATLNGRPIHASAKDKLSDCVLSLALAGRSVSSRARAIRREVRVSRSMGSAALALAYVGNGRFDGFIQETSLSLWDIAAAGLIAERAGATVTSFDGSAWYDPGKVSRSIGLIAAPPAFQAPLRELANRR